jgi:hypothetical protein
MADALYQLGTALLAQCRHYRLSLNAVTDGNLHFD